MMCLMLLNPRIILLRPVEVCFNWTEPSLGYWSCLLGSGGHSAQDAGWEFTPTAGLPMVLGLT